MNEPILRAVAMPPRLFWAPQVPALINLGIQFFALFVLLAMFQTNPLWIVLVSLFPSHILLVMLGTREPHLSEMLKSQGRLAKNYRAIYKDPGRKLAS